MNQKDPLNTPRLGVDTQTLSSRRDQVQRKDEEWIGPAFRKDLVSSA